MSSAVNECLLSDFNTLQYPIKKDPATCLECESFMFQAFASKFVNRSASPKVCWSS